MMTMMMMKMLKMIVIGKVVVVLSYFVVEDDRLAPAGLEIAQASIHYWLKGDSNLFDWEHILMLLFRKQLWKEDDNDDTELDNAPCLSVRIDIWILSHNITICQTQPNNDDTGWALLQPRKIGIHTILVHHSKVKCLNIYLQDQKVLGKWVINYKTILSQYFTFFWPSFPFSFIFSCFRVWSSEIPLSESMELFGISQFMFGQPWCWVKRN